MTIATMAKDGHNDECVGGVGGNKAGDEDGYDAPFLHLIPGRDDAVVRGSYLQGCQT